MPFSAKLPTLRKNITKTSLSECLDFLSKIPPEHRIILSQDRSLANCLFHSLLLFQADIPSIYLSHKEMLQPQLKTKTPGFGSTPIKWENLVLVNFLLRYSVMLNWQLALDTQSETTGELPSRMLVEWCFFSTVKYMDIDVQQVISIFHYSGLGYIKVSIAIFCQLRFIWILMSRSRNRLHLAQRPMCTEPN